MNSYLSFRRHCTRTLTAPRRAPREFVAEYSRASPLRSSSLSFSSDEFIQAQQQLARWASEDVVPAAAQRDYFPSPAGSSSSEATLRAGASSAHARPPGPPEYTH